ncbi:MAG: hypothetical protein C5B44_04635 [Acidobacteria bacterium]|nr:MAG: hypothetical protein C5B44_04635 [Acidobacteriota bacterium]
MRQTPNQSPDDSSEQLLPHFSLCFSRSLLKWRQFATDDLSPRIRRPLSTTTLPIMRAIAEGDAEKLRDLLVHGADVNCRNQSGQTALMMAALLGHSEIIPLLLQFGADVRLRDNQGLSALEWSQRRGFAEITEILSNALPPDDATVNQDKPRSANGLGPAATAILKTVQAERQAAGAERTALDDSAISNRQREVPQDTPLRKATRRDVEESQLRAQQELERLGLIRPPTQEPSEEEIREKAQQELRRLGLVSSRDLLPSRHKFRANVEQERKTVGPHPSVTPETAQPIPDKPKVDELPVVTTTPEIQSPPPRTAAASASLPTATSQPTTTQAVGAPLEQRTENSAPESTNLDSSSVPQPVPAQPPTASENIPTTQARLDQVTPGPNLPPIPFVGATQPLEAPQEESRPPGFDTISDIEAPAFSGTPETIETAETTATEPTIASPSQSPSAAEVSTPAPDFDRTIADFAPPTNATSQSPSAADVSSPAPDFDRTIADFAPPTNAPETLEQAKSVVPSEETVDESAVAKATRRRSRVTTALRETTELKARPVTEPLKVPPLVSEPIVTTSQPSNTDTPSNSASVPDQTSAMPISPAQPSRTRGAILNLSEPRQATTPAIPLPEPARTVAPSQRGVGTRAPIILFLLLLLLGSGVLTFLILRTRFSRPQSSAQPAAVTPTSASAPTSAREKHGPFVAGTLAGAELNVPDAEYPADANGRSTAVTVEVRVNGAGGVVIAAHALNGDSLFRKAAEKAARSARFAPEKLPKDTKVASGTITYNFGTSNVQPVVVQPGNDTPVLGGALVGTEVSVPKAEYPTGNKGKTASGVVIVVVRVNRMGDVIAARPLNGPTQLRNAAVRAAKQAKFSREKLPKESLVTSGTITYNFTPTTTSASASTVAAPPTSAPAEAAKTPAPNASSAPPAENAKRAADIPVVSGELAGKEANIPKAEYPAQARRKGLSGTVQMLVRVNRQGKVISWRTLSGDQVFRASALKAAKKATFSPAKLGKIDTVLGTITYTFKP